MKIRLEFEIPNWTRWMAVGLAAGLALGYGLASARAALEPTVPSTVWNPNDVLTAAALNKNFQELSNALNAQVSAITDLQAAVTAQQAAVAAQQLAMNSLGDPDCPTGYSRDSSAPLLKLCRKGEDQVIKVGSGGSAFWIDRYEASIWSQLDGTGTQFGLSVGDFPGQFPINGQYGVRLYARSQVGHLPAVFVNWYQADAACEASGKRLPNGVEWLRAARGTSDPGLSTGTNGNCLTSGTARRSTGQGGLCVSQWGVEDMIGNVWEWTEDASAGLGLDPALALGGPTSFGAMTNQGFSDDALYNVASLVFDNNYNLAHVPAAANRGGSFSDGAEAGVFALNLEFGAIFTADHLGFRCVVSR